MCFNKEKNIIKIIIRKKFYFIIYFNKLKNF